MNTQKDLINWTHALNGRMRGAENGPFSKKSGVIAAQLGKEIRAGALPFIDMPFKEELEQQLPKVMERFKGLKHMILLGIGGSALGPRALQKAFYPQQDHPGHCGPTLWIADNINAPELDAWLDKLHPKECLAVVISKSGGTIETMAQYFIVREWLKKHLDAQWTEQVLIITDPTEGPLRKEAEEPGIAALPVPHHLGGRYSVLSAVGMAPAFFCGMDWQALLRGAKSICAPLVKEAHHEGQIVEALIDHPAWKLAVWARELMERQYSQLIFFSYIPAWSCLGAWFAQLWAESLGKAGKGSMPLPATGVTDQHSLQQMFLDGPKDKGCLFLTCPNLPQGRAFGADLPEKWAYLKGKHFGDLLQAEGLGTRMALTMAEVPLAELRLAKADEEAAGRLIAILELATLLTGKLLEINPIDQPAVELGKRLANARLGAAGYEKELEDLKKFLGQAEKLQEI